MSALDWYKKEIASQDFHKEQVKKHKQVQQKVKEHETKIAREKHINLPARQKEIERKRAVKNEPVKATQKRDSGMKWLGKNAMAGVGNFNRALFKSLDFLLPTEYMFQPGRDPISNLNKKYSKDADYFNTNAEKSSKSRGKGWETAGKLVSGTVEAVPNLALAYLTMGASTAGNALTATGGAASHLAAQESVKRIPGLLGTVARAGRDLSRNPMFWSSFLQTVGSDYEDSLKEGASPVQATASAMISGLVNSIVEVGGGIETMPRAMRGGNKQAIRAWVKSALEEGQEEVVQGVISNLTSKAIYDHNRKWYSNQNPDAIVNPQRMAQEFGMGAAIGGILGAPAMGINSAIENRAMRNRAEIDAQNPVLTRENVSNDIVNPKIEKTAEMGDSVPNTASPVEKAVRSMGENGKKAFGVNYNSNSDFETYSDSFSRYYEAGRNGVPAETIENFDENFTPDIQQAAYSAGQNDSAVAVPKPEAGFFKGKANVDSRTEESLDKVGKAVGVRIEVIESMENPEAQGTYKNGTIYLAENADDPYFTIAKHELTHYMQENAPEEYKAYRDNAINIIAGNSGTQKMNLISQYQSSAKENGVNLTADEAMDEIAADFTEYIVKDENALRDFVGKNDRTVVQKFFDAVRNFLNKIKAAFKGRKAQNEIAEETFGVTVSELEHAEQLWLDMLSESENASREGRTQSSQSEEFSIKGQKDILKQNLELKEYNKNLEEKVEKLRGEFKRTRNSDPDMDSVKDVSKKLVKENKSDYSVENLTDEVADLYKFMVTKKKGEFPSFEEVQKRASEIAEKVLSESLNINDDLYQEYSRLRKDLKKTRIKIGDADNADFADGFNEFRKKNFGKFILAKDGVSVESVFTELAEEYPEFFDAEEVTHPADQLKEIARVLDEIKPFEESMDSARMQQSIEFLADELIDEMYSIPRTPETFADKKQAEKVEAVKKARERKSRQMEATVKKKQAEKAEAVQKVRAQKDESAKVKVQKAKASKDAQIAELKKRAAADIRAKEREIRKMRAELKKTNDSTPNIQKMEEIAGNIIRQSNSSYDAGKFADKLGSLYRKMWANVKKDGSAPTLKQIEDNARGIVKNVFKSAEIPSNDYKDAVDVTVEYVLEELYNAPRAEKTFADTQAELRKEMATEKAEALDELREQKNERIEQIRENLTKSKQQALEKTRADRDEKLRKLREHHRETVQNASTKRKKSTCIKSIKKHVNDLSRKLTTNSDAKHIPEEFRKLVAQFLRRVDFTNSRISDKTLTEINNLKAKYEDIAQNSSDYNFTVLDDEITDNLEKVYKAMDKIKGRTVYELDLDTLETLRKAVLAMEKSISYYNRMISDRKAMTREFYGESVINENRTSKEFKEKAGLAGKLDDMLNSEMVRPEDFFHELGGTMESFYRDIRDGWDTAIRHLEEGARYLKETLKENKVDINEISGEKAESEKFTLHDGTSIELTKGQIMSLYLLDRQGQDSWDHMYSKNGGISPAPRLKQVKEEGKLLPKTELVNDFEVSKVDESDVKKILESLSQSEKKVADAVSKFFAESTSEWGNEVSMKMYGYKKFMVENYFPIVVNNDYLATVAAETQDSTLKNMGITKERKKGANNPIVIEDIFDVYARQVNQMANYNAFVIPLTDVQSVYNYKNENGTVKTAIKKNLGKRANGYFEQLMRDLNGGVRYEGGWNLLSDAISRYKQAKMGLNLRVVAQQPTSYLRASAVIEPKYLAKAMTSRSKADFETIMDYSPIARWKEWGFFSIDTGKNVKDLILGKKDLSDYTMKGAAKADEVTWKRLWRAGELKVLDETNLKEGSDEFYKATAKIFNEIIDRTQVVDSTLHRSQIMRNPDSLVKMSVSFMSEPMASYNLMRTALRDARKNPSETTKKIARRAVTAYLVQTIVNNLVTGLMDAWRGDDDDEFLLDKLNKRITDMVTGEEISEDETAEIPTFAERWVKHFADNAVTEPISMFPFIKDIFSMMQGYDVKRMDMAGISDLIKSVQRSQNDAFTWKFKLADMTAKAADLFGIPASSLKRELEALTKNALRIKDDPVLEFEVKKQFYPFATNKKTYMDLLFRTVKAQDMDAYTEMVAQLVDGGIEGTFIENAIKSRALKDKEIKENLKDYEPFLMKIGVRYKEKEKTADKFGPEDLNGTEYAKYNRIRGEALTEIENYFKGEEFASLSKDEQDSAVGSAYAYARSKAMKQVTGAKYTEDSKWILNMDKAKEWYGMSNGEYLVYKAKYPRSIGYRLFDKDKEGNTVPSEAFKKSKNLGISTKEYMEVCETYSNTDAKDANGNTVTGLKKKRLVEYLNSLPGITQEKYNFYMREVFNYKRG